MHLPDYALLLAGVIFAAFGGELFVRGIIGISHWARLSHGIVSTTVAAFATSSPELSVSINAALAAKPQIALGDALGSNVVNIALILGLALLGSGLHDARKSGNRETVVALLVPVVIGALFLDGILSRFDGLLLLILFGTWLVVNVKDALQQRSLDPGHSGEQHGCLAVVFCAAGLGFLFASGYLIVEGAKGMALAFGVDEFVVGATIVAIGTSMPELATALISRFRGHAEIGIGTLLGSNIFNGFFIIAVAAIIHPIATSLQEVAIALVCGMMAVALLVPSRNATLDRHRGLLLLMIYAAYVLTIAQSRPL